MRALAEPDSAWPDHANLLRHVWRTSEGHPLMIMETLRALLFGTAVGSNGVLAVAWCLAIALTGYLWAKRLYERDPTAL